MEQLSPKSPARSSAGTVDQKGRLHKGISADEQVNQISDESACRK